MSLHWCGRGVITAMVVLASIVLGFGQNCPTCVIDVTCDSVPAYPNICPNSLPSDTVNKYYESSFTFYLPANFTDPGTGQNVDFQQMDVINVGQLPTGLAWSSFDYMGVETTTFYPDSDPAGGSERGCATLCGTPLVPGVYQVKIDVVVQVYASSVGINVTQNETFYMQLTIYSDGGNTVFTMTDALGCDSVTTQFDPILASGGNPLYEYDWDFGNGNLDSVENPSFSFDSAGIYPVIGTTNIYEFILTDVTFQVNNSALWCGDVEEPNWPLLGCTEDPDPFFQLYNSGGLQIYSSSVITGTSVSWSGLNVVLDGSLFSYQFWDDDDVSPDDNLGSVPFNVTNTGTYNASGADIIVTWTIGKQIAETYSDTDTVYVYAPPVIGNVTISVDSICDGDSIMLAVDGGYNYQWYNDSNIVFGALDSVLWAYESGTYSVLVTNSYNCTASSDTVTATIVDYPPVATLVNMGDHLRTFATGYDIQWYFNGSLVPGATYDTLNFNQAGDYSLTLSNNFGCSTFSNSIYVVPLSVDYLEFMQQSIQVYPNPNNGIFDLEYALWKPGEAKIVVTDIVGKVLFSTIEKNASGKIVSPIQLDALGQGIYFLYVEIEGNKVGRRFLVQ